MSEVVATRVNWWLRKPRWKRVGAAILIYVALLLVKQVVDVMMEEPYHHQAMAAVRDRARDPSSVQFDDIFTRQRPGHIPVVCGRVNQSNEFGGRTGFVWFYYQPPTAGQSGDIAISTTPFEVNLVRNVCDLVPRGVR